GSMAGDVEPETTDVAGRPVVVEDEELAEVTDQVGDGDRVGPGAGRGDLSQGRPEEVLLPVDPVEVAAGERLALTDVLQCLVPVQVVGAAVGGLQVDPPERVGDALETLEVDDGHVVD